MLRLEGEVIVLEIGLWCGVKQDGDDSYEQCLV